MNIRIRKTIAQRLEEQRRWIREHGGSESAYVLRYGSAADPVHYGDGGEAIFAADMGALVTLSKRARVEVRL